MAVRKLGKNKYQIDYYPEGRSSKRKRFTVHGTEKEARIVEQQVRKQHSGLARGQANPKIISVTPHYLAWVELHQRRTTYEDKVLNFTKHLDPFFGQHIVRTITPESINEYKRHRKDEGVSNKTINKELYYFSALIKWMVREGYTYALPFKIEPLPYKRPKPYVPALKDIEKFFSNIIGEDKLAIAKLYFEAGLRSSEALNIKFEQVDFQSNIITLEQKGGDDKICILPEGVKAYIKSINKSKGYVFPNPRTGLPYQSLKIMFKLVCERAGIRRFHPHSLRHAFGKYNIEAGTDLRTLQEMMGHSTQ